MNLESSFDRSLERHFKIVHDPDALAEVLSRVFDDRLDESLVKYDLQEELVDRDFLDHGVEEPPQVDKKEFTTEDGKFKNNSGEQLYRLCKKWQNAFDVLEERFIKKACVAHDLRLVFDRKRKENKVLSAKVTPHLKKTVTAPVRTTAASSSSSSAPKSKGKCGCRTKCSSPNCGCRRSGQGCSPACGCGGEDGCANPRTYADTDEGLESYTKALAGAMSENVLKELPAKPKVEDMEEEE